MKIEEGLLRELSFREDMLSKSSPPPLLSELEKQLDEYFRGQRKYFDVPTLIEGSAFRLDCLKAMSEIDYGETISYSELASNAGYPKAIRAAASVCAKNPIVIIYPCHRVVKKDKSIGNYGAGREKKLWLLELEKNSKRFQ